MSPDKIVIPRSNRWRSIEYSAAEFSFASFVWDATAATALKTVNPFGSADSTASTSSCSFIIPGAKHARKVAITSSLPSTSCMDLIFNLLGLYAYRRHDMLYIIYATDKKIKQLVKN